MIKSWGELGEFLAEFENRISYLENSQGVSEVKQPEEQSKTTLITQEKRLLLHLQRKFNDHLDEKAERYTIK